MTFLIALKENIIISLKAIVANKMRSFLATLGIVIGITAVTLMQTAIEGINRAFESSIASIGSDVLYVQKYEWFGKEDWEYYRNRKDITMRHYEFLKKNLQTAASISPSVGTAKAVQYQSLYLDNVFIIGTDDEYQKTVSLNIDNGRFLSQRESENGYPVAVIGMDVKNALFPNSNPIGKIIKVGTYSFRVIGVIEKQGSLLGLFSLDNRIIIPIKRFFKLYGTKRTITINVKAADMNNLDETREELNFAMRKIRKIPVGGKNDFGINAQEAFKQTYDQLTSLIKIIGLIITSLSLIVGSVGIANIMFVSVKERTKEIGIRKAIGARRGVILSQFLIESSIICLLGGIVGVLIAYPVSLIIDAFILPTVMPLWIVFIGLFISLIFGLISGFFPAFNASKLDPVESLRYE
ncbi:MAG: ABC transporter permease [Ignavibacteria bacterium]|nr:ABC transporter permease [Ignavibacteria bacterium]